MIVHKNRGYIGTFPEHVRFLIENSTHEVWVVYKSKDKPMERVTKENYEVICAKIEKDYVDRVHTDSLYMVSNIGDITMSISTDSRGNVHTSINDTDTRHKIYYNWE